MVYLGLDSCFFFFFCVDFRFCEEVRMMMGGEIAPQGGELVVPLMHRSIENDDLFAGETDRHRRVVWFLVEKREHKRKWS